MAAHSCGCRCCSLQCGTQPCSSWSEHRPVHNLCCHAYIPSPWLTIYTAHYKQWHSLVEAVMETVPLGFATWLRHAYIPSPWLGLPREPVLLLPAPQAHLKALRHSVQLSFTLLQLCQLLLTLVYCFPQPPRQLTLDKLLHVHCFI